MVRHLLLISSSRVYGYAYLEKAKCEIQKFLNSKGVTSILFIPYAQKDYVKYLEMVSAPLSEMGYKVYGIHEQDNPIEAVRKAQAIFIGGGNTFLLLKTLYENNLIEIIREMVLKNGIPYIGTSAGTNVATCSIHVTNDMPIVYPPTFEALKLIDFNINPHYIETDPSTKHKGETRDERILEYLDMDHAKSVLALREGSMLKVEGDKAILLGFPSKLFQKNGCIQEIESGADISFLLI